MPKFAIVFIVVCTTCGCVSSKIRPVYLQPVDETGQVMGSVWQAMAPREPLAAELEAAREMEADSFLVFEFEHKKKDTAAEAAGANKSGTMLPDVNLLDSRSMVMAVYKSGELFLLVDENNNNRVDDDQAVKIDPAVPERKHYDDYTSLPFFRVHGLRTIYEGREVFFRKSFYLLPRAATGGSLSMNLISNEQKQGSFRYKKQAYTIRARNTMSQYFSPGTSQVILRVDSPACPPGAEYDAAVTGAVTDTLHAGNTRFMVKKMSGFMEVMDIVAIPPVKSKKRKGTPTLAIDSTGTVKP